MAKIRFRLLRTALMTLLLLFSACGDGVDLKCDDSNTIHINQHSRDFFYFKPGTWWLYRQEGSDLTDSVWVSHTGIESDNASAAKSDCKCGYGKCVEKISMRLQTRAYSGSDFASYYVISTELNKTTSIYGSVNGFRSAYSPLSGNWEYDDNNLESRNSGILDIKTEDTLTAYGKLYQDILHIFSHKGDYGNAFLHDVWFARNYFVVRYKRYDNTTWNLVDYNIVK